jgi:hypothetical protein
MKQLQTSFLPVSAIETSGTQTKPEAIARRRRERGADTPRHNIRNDGITTLVKVRVADNCRTRQLILQGCPNRFCIFLFLVYVMKLSMAIVEE